MLHLLSVELSFTSQCFYNQINIWTISHFGKSITISLQKCISGIIYQLYFFSYLLSWGISYCCVNIGSYCSSMFIDPGLVHHHHFCYCWPPGYLLYKLPLQSQLPAAHILEKLYGERKGMLWYLCCGIRHQTGREKSPELLWEQGPWTIPFPQPQGMGGDLCTLHILKEWAVLQHPAAVCREDRQGLDMGEETCHGLRGWNRDELEEEDLIYLPCHYWIKHRHSKNRQRRGG